MTTIQVQDSIAERLAKSAEAQGLSLEAYLEGLAFGRGAEETDGSDYVPFVASAGDPNVTWEQVRAITAKFSGSLSADIDRERDERF